MGLQRRRLTVMAVGLALGAAGGFGVAACGDDERGGVEVEGSGTGATGTATGAGTAPETTGTGAETTTTP